MQAGGAAVEASEEIEQNNAEEKRKRCRPRVNLVGPPVSPALSPHLPLCFQGPSAQATLTRQDEQFHRKERAAEPHYI